MISPELYDLNLLAIVVMGITTFLMRAGGFWVMGRVLLTSRVRRMLDALPGSIVAAIVVPIVIKIGFVAAFAVIVAAAVMILSRNAFLAVAMGVLVGALARSAGM